MTKLLDAMDELHRARDIARLIAMTTRESAGDDENAISAGCEVIEARFEAAFRLLKEFNDEARLAAQNGLIPYGR